MGRPFSWAPVSWGGMELQPESTASLYEADRLQGEATPEGLCASSYSRDVTSTPRAWSEWGVQRCPLPPSGCPTPKDGFKSD